MKKNHSKKNSVSQDKEFNKLVNNLEIKLVLMSLHGQISAGLAMHSHIENNPLTPYFERLLETARDLRDLICNDE